MQSELWWWGWSGFAGSAWTCVVCLVVLLGSIINLAVLVHWFTTKPTQESPSAALPFVDFLVCLLAAPLRYNSHISHNNSLFEEDILSSDVNCTSELQEDEALLLSEMRDAGMNESENVDPYVSQDNNTDYSEKLPRAQITNDSVHAVVVFICLMSLHVVVMVAIHRLALLLRCSPSICLSVRITPLILVLIVTLVSSGSLVGGLHATGVFTSQLPLLGIVEYSPESSPSPLVIAFLSYIAGLCGIATFCYTAIITALLYQGRDRSTASPSSDQDPQILTLSTTSSTTAPKPTEETAVQTYSGSGKTIRACLTVVSVLVTLTICWAIPVSLALYALLSETRITPALPYSDVLLLLSGLIHPFVYGEGWVALGACYTGVQRTVLTTAYRMGLKKRTRAPKRPKVRNRKLHEERVTPHQEFCCYCCPSRSRIASQTPEAQPFSELPKFVHSSTTRQGLPLHEADPL